MQFLCHHHPSTPRSRDFNFGDDAKSFHLVHLSLHLLMKRDGYTPGSKQRDWFGVPFQFDLIGFTQIS